MGVVSGVLSASQLLCSPAGGVRLGDINTGNDKQLHHLRVVLAYGSVDRKLRPEESTTGSVWPSKAVLRQKGAQPFLGVGALLSAELLALLTTALWLTRLSLACRRGRCCDRFIGTSRLARTRPACSVGSIKCL